MGIIINSFSVSPSGPTATAHRYWRIFVTSNNGSDTVFGCVVGEMEMRESVGGADVTGSGTASADSEFSGSFTASNAFANDGDTTFWARVASPAPATLSYDFGSGVTKAIVEIAIMGRDGGGNSVNQAPGAFKVQSSDDGSTWADEWWIAYPGGTNGHGMSNDTFKVFTKPVSEQAPSANRHRYWRLNITASNGGSFVGAEEIEMRVITSGNDECTGGTATSLTNFVGLTPTQAFDNDISSDWASDGSAFPQWLKYDFGSGNAKQIVEISYIPRLSAPSTQSPTDFNVQYSDDNSSWTTLWSESGITGWSGAAAKIFTKP